MMYILLFTIFLLTSLICVNCYEITPHRHRHSQSHDEYNLDRLMNRLDNHSPASTKEIETTSKPPHKDIFDDFYEPVTETNPEAGNSLWDDDSIGDASTSSPLDAERWEKILKGRADKEKEREQQEDVQDDLSDQEDGFEDIQEQADTYSSWNARNGESYSSWKWENMGNRKSIDSMFQVYRSGLLKPDSTNKDTQARYEVYQHNKQMSRETLCRFPRPKVIRVSDVYPSSSKLYVPPCTVLHQCGEDTGCCAGTGQRCGPKTTKRVELYFYTTYMVSGNSRQRTSSGLEKLPFYNHTECECLDRLEEVMPRDGQNAEYRAERNLNHGCKCPSEYTVRRLANGSCSCDCFDKQRDCIKYKRGKEYFGHSDRLCIEMGTCQLPACDFGIYLRSSGRCPRKHEKFRTWSRFH